MEYIYKISKINGGLSGICAAALSIKNNVTPRQLVAEKVRNEISKKGIEL